MGKKKGWKLTEGSRYRVISLGGKDSIMKTEGIFRGFANLGLDDVGLCIEQGREKRKVLRIIPLQAVLAIDVLSEKKTEDKDEDEELPEFYI